MAVVIARAYFTTVAILFFTNEISSPDKESGSQ